MRPGKLEAADTDTHSPATGRGRNAKQETHMQGKKLQLGAGPNRWRTPGDARGGELLLSQAQESETRVTTGRLGKKRQAAGFQPSVLFIIPVV